jgi:hypothetical protein
MRIWTFLFFCFISLVSCFRTTLKFQQEPKLVDVPPSSGLFLLKFGADVGICDMNRTQIGTTFSLFSFKPENLMLEARIDASFPNSLSSILLLAHALLSFSNNGTHVLASVRNLQKSHAQTHTISLHNVIHQNTWVHSNFYFPPNMVCTIVITSWTEVEFILFDIEALHVIHKISLTVKEWKSAVSIPNQNKLMLTWISVDDTLVVQILDLLSGAFEQPKILGKPQNLIGCTGYSAENRFGFFCLSTNEKTNEISLLSNEKLERAFSFPLTKELVAIRTLRAQLVLVFRSRLEKTQVFSYAVLDPVEHRGSQEVPFLTLESESSVQFVDTVKGIFTLIKNSNSTYLGQLI